MKSWKGESKSWDFWNLLSWIRVLGCFSNLQSPSFPLCGRPVNFGWLTPPSCVALGSDQPETTMRQVEGWTGNLQVRPITRQRPLVSHRVIVQGPAPAPGDTGHREPDTCGQWEGKEMPFLSWMIRSVYEARNQYNPFSAPEKQA